MGYEKRMKMEADERGYLQVGKSVCPDCVNDEFLRQLIIENGDEGECDYCFESSVKDTVVGVDFLMPCIAAGLQREFADPHSVNVPRDDGAWILPTFDTDIALHFTGLDCDFLLHDDIAKAFVNTEWVIAAKGSWMHQQPHEELASLWDEFVQSIKHETRFFLRERTSAQSQGPHQILEQIRSLVVSTGLIRRIDAGQQFYRCRLRRSSDTWEPNGKELGAPPRDLASAGRMNPAGIAYLYTAFDMGTALAEVVGRPPFEITVGRFQNKRALNIVDLSNLPKPPSPFDEARIQERQNLLFLRRFAELISQPVGKDGTEHIDYVPSQVVCEYFAQVVKFHGQDNVRIDGLAYPSAVMPTGRNLVLFPTQRGFDTEFDHIDFMDGKNVTVGHWQDLMDLMQDPEDPAA